MIIASTQQQKNRDVKSDIDLLSTAPELQSVVIANPHNILTLVEQHITIMVGPVIEPFVILELLAHICQQLRYVAQRNYKLVIQKYAKAVEDYPTNTYVHFSLGTLEQQLGNYHKAINAFTQAMSENAIEVIVRYSVAQCLLYQGYPDRAIQQLLHALRTVRSASNKAFANSVWAARPRKESEEDGTPEQEIFKLLTKADQRIQRLTLKQPILQLKQTPPPQPESILTAPSPDASSSPQEELASTQNTPDDPHLHHERAKIFLQSGLLDDAITELRVLTFIYLSSKQLRDAGATIQRISQIHARVGDIEEALTNLHYALELVPDNVAILCECVEFCRQLGMKKEAAQYQMAIARHYFDLHQYSEAVTALQQLLTFDATTYEAYDLLGQIYQLQGDLEQSSKVYRQLAKLHSDSSIAWNRKATLQEAQIMQTG